MRVERLIYSLLILVAAATAILNWRRAMLLAADNEQLRTRMESLENEMTGSSNMVDIAQNLSDKVRKQTSELMQLRNEVTQLRTESNKNAIVLSENQRLKADLSQLKASVASVQSGQTNNTHAHRFPRENWSFAGYGSPEAALVSAIWSMKEGNPRSYLESLAPSEQERMAAVWQNKSEGEIAEKHKNDVAAISGIRVMQAYSLAADEVVMDVFLEGVERTERVRLNQVGQDWKFGGFVREQKAP